MFSGAAHLGVGEAQAGAQKLFQVKAGHAVVPLQVLQPARAAALVCTAREAVGQHDRPSVLRRRERGARAATSGA